MAFADGNLAEVLSSTEKGSSPVNYFPFCRAVKTMICEDLTLTEYLVPGWEPGAFPRAVFLKPQADPLSSCHRSISRWLQVHEEAAALAGSNGTFAIEEPGEKKFN